MTAARRTSVSSTGVERGDRAGDVDRANPEIARLKAALDGLDGTPPAGRTIVIGGEAGIGKSRLVSALIETAVDGGATALVGACLPTPTGSVPYAPFVEALRELTRSTEPGRLAGLLGPARDEIGRLFPEMGGPARTPGGGGYSRPEPMEADRAGQGRLFEAILTVFERLGRNGPIVLAIEDIQWADVGTRSLIAFLSRNLRNQPVVLLVTLRTDDPDPLVPTTRLLGELERQSWVERIELGPLSAPRWQACCARSVAVAGRRRRSLMGSWHGREATRSSSSSSRRRMAASRRIGVCRPACATCSPADSARCLSGRGRSFGVPPPRDGASTRTLASPRSHRSSGRRGPAAGRRSRRAGGCRSDGWRLRVPSRPAC